MTERAKPGAMASDWSMRWTAAIVQCFPSFEVRSLAETPQGADSEVALINERWIFRRAKRPEVVEWFAKEHALLPELAKRVPGRVPIFEYSCMTHGLVGYRKIEGEPLTSELAETTGPAITGGELGRFLSALHAFPTEEAHRLGVPVNPLGMPSGSIGLFEPPPAFDPQKSVLDNDWPASFLSARDRTVEGLAPLLTGVELTTLRDRFDTVLANPDVFRFRPVLVHTELHPEHVLFGEDGRISGVIDWSDASIGDPVADLALVAGYSPEFGAAVLAAYGSALDAGMVQRANVARLVGSYLHLRHGQALADDRIVEEAVARVRTNLSDPWVPPSTH